MENFKNIERLIEYSFKNLELLKLAFIHSSNGKPNNQRLEFLGDSVLDLIVANILIENKNNSEGQLTKKRATLVCEENLSDIIRGMGLEKYLTFGKSFKGEVSNAVCADLFEAIVGAIYLDCNYSLTQVTEFVKKHLDFSVCNSIDYISALQELVFQDKNSTIEYKTKEISCVGDEHNFESEVYINGLICATARGASKKEAKKNVAKLVYENLIRMNEKWYLKK